MKLATASSDAKTSPLSKLKNLKNYLKLLKISEKFCRPYLNQTLLQLTNYALINLGLVGMRFTH
jgi:hypothetical protein